MYKKAARQILPDNAYERAAVRWREFRGTRERYIWNLSTLFKRGLPELLFHFGIGPGDDLLCTVLLRELKKRGQKKIWMMSKNSGLFELNDDLDLVVPIDDRYRAFIQAFGKKWKQLAYSRYFPEEDRSESPKLHIIAEMCSRADIQGPIALRPYFHVKEEERAKAARVSGFIAIQSSGLGGQLPMQNKQWHAERFQLVVDALKGKFKFVQLGSASDPLLKNAADLRGKTSLRETGAVLERCRLFVGNVGFLMHLARAVECPSVIIYGGREAPWQSGYTCNSNLYSAVPCAPCWLWNKCDHDRVCMDKITAEDVIHAVERMTAQPSGKLVVDEVTI